MWTHNQLLIPMILWCFVVEEFKFPLRFVKLLLEPQKHVTSLLYYTHGHLCCLVPLVADISRGAEWWAEGWTGFQRAGLSGPDHLPGIILATDQTETYHIVLSCGLFLHFALISEAFVCCQCRSWLVKRSYEDFRVLDKHLHLCIYDRRYSQLTELPRCDTLKHNVEVNLESAMSLYSTSQGFNLF